MTEDQPEALAAVERLGEAIGGIGAPEAPARGSEAPAVPGVTRWRKRPVIVEAIQWTGGNFAALKDFASGALGTGEVMNGAVPLWAVKSQALCHVQRGDWIIREADGSGFYPCAGDVFAATYEPALPVAAALESNADGTAPDDTGRALPSSDVKAQGHLWPDSGEPHQPGPKRMVGRRVVCYCRCGKPWPCDRSWQARAEAAEGKLAAQREYDTYRRALWVLVRQFGGSVFLTSGQMEDVPLLASLGCGREPGGLRINAEEEP